MICIKRNYIIMHTTNSEIQQMPRMSFRIVYWQRLNKYISWKIQKPFSSWLFRILYCGCSANIKTQISNKSNADISNYENSISYDNNLEFEREELKQALNILKTDERNIVLLSVVAGFNSKEISKITGYSSGNVRQKLSRSLSKMKIYLS